MKEGGGRLRISLQDLRPMTEHVEIEADLPPLSGGPESLTFVSALPVSAQDTSPSGRVSDGNTLSDDPLSDMMNTVGREGRGDFGDETVVGQTGSDESIIAERYRIEETIGAGGMGKVFRVRHRRLGKSFALKLMRTAFAGDAHSRELFYREARLASSLAHPNIVSIIDFGEDPKLGAFMVMELLEGETLSRRLQRDGRFSIKPALDVILQVAEALHYIHKRQIVHCDIKPDNILLTAMPPGARRKYSVKLLDFGLARFGSMSTTGNSTEVAGTPEYMAPERIKGLSPRPSMDIYGLGVLAYEVINGRPPFMGTLSTVLHDHVLTAPAPFSKHLREPVDERAEGLVMKALAKDPAARQKDMAAFLYELRTLMDMLGFGRRRGVASGQAARVSADRRDRRTRAATVGYDLSPLPMAGLNVDGQIVVANRAFTQFVSGVDSTSSALETTNIHATRFLEVHPDLSADLRRVHVSAEPLQRILQLTVQDKRPIRLMLWMVPGTTDAGEIQLVVHTLDD